MEKELYRFYIKNTYPSWHQCFPYLRGAHYSLWSFFSIQFNESSDSAIHTTYSVLWSSNHILFNCPKMVRCSNYFHEGKWKLKMNHALGLIQKSVRPCTVLVCTPMISNGACPPMSSQKMVFPKIVLLCPPIICPYVP